MRDNQKLIDAIEQAQAAIVAAIEQVKPPVYKMTQEEADLLEQANNDFIRKEAVRTAKRGWFK